MEKLFIKRDRSRYFIIGRIGLIMVKMLFIIKTTIKRPIILYSLFVACTVKPTSEISESSIRYNKQVVEIEMRDGIKLNTEIYVPPNTD